MSGPVPDSGSVIRNLSRIFLFVLILVGNPSRLIGGEESKTNVDKANMGRSDEEPKTWMTSSCRLFEAPNESAKPVCIEKKGTLLKFVDLEKYEKHYYHVISPSRCQGFVLDSCVGIETHRRVSSEELERRMDSELSFPAPRLGLFMSLDGLWGKVGYDSTASTGLGYNFGVHSNFHLFSRWRVSVGVAYQMLRLGRQLDADGALVDPSPSEFSQTGRYLGTLLLLGYHWNPNIHSRVGTPTLSEIDWYVEGGVEYLFPQSMIQTDSVLGERQIALRDKPVFFLLGLSGNYPMQEGLDVVGSFWAFYNVAGKSSSKLFGIRVGVAFQLVL